MKTVLNEFSALQIRHAGAGTGVDDSPLEIWSIKSQIVIRLILTFKYWSILIARIIARHSEIQGDGPPISTHKTAFAGVHLRCKTKLLRLVHTAQRDEIKACSHSATRRERRHQSLIAL